VARKVAEITRENFNMNRESRAQLRNLLLKIGLNDSDLPISEPELHRRQHDRLTVKEYEQLKELLAKSNLLEPMV
jgi:uncharacterized tellurite resistance protein B-like protein